MALEAQGEGKGAATIQGSRSGRGIIHAPGLAEQQVLRENSDKSMSSNEISLECDWEADYYCGRSKTDKELWGEFESENNQNNVHLNF